MFAVHIARFLVHDVYGIFQFIFACLRNVTLALLMTLSTATHFSLHGYLVTPESPCELELLLRFMDDNGQCLCLPTCC